MEPDFTELTEAFLARFDEGGGDARSTELRGVRAPGRVNLIGEHIDYNGLPVLPMAIQRELRMVYRPSSDATVRVENVDPAHGSVEFSLERLPGAAPAGSWTNYLLAAAQELAPFLGSAESPAVGFDAIVTSTLPPDAGLSSSSALVVAMGLALVESNGHRIGREDLAARMARAERFVGTEGGGMDQAVILGATKAHALLVEFDPLSTRAIPLPDGWRLIVAHSLESAKKSGAAQEEYNRRTRECRMALEQLGEGSYAELLGEKRVGGGSRVAGAEHASAQQILERASQRLSGDVWRRFRHVVTEYHRVIQAVEAMTAADLHAMGALMSASHASLRQDYDVSTPELDMLVDLAVGAGAVGARVTGAGFGGAIVALCTEDTAPRVLTALEAGFFSARDAEITKLSDVLFVAEASAGATIHAL